MKKLILFALIFLFLGCIEPVQIKCDKAVSDQEFENDLVDCFDQVYEFNKYYGIKSPWGKKGLNGVVLCMKSKGYSCYPEADNGQEMFDYMWKVWTGE